MPKKKRPRSLTDLPLQQSSSTSSFGPTIIGKKAKRDDNQSLSDSTTVHQKQKSETKEPKVVRKISDNFRFKHIRRSDGEVDYDKMGKEAQSTMAKRSQGNDKTVNSLIYLTEEQEQVFLQEEHECLGKNRYQSTTMFPAVESTLMGNVRFYSAAKFVYEGTLDKDGLLNIDHFRQISSKESYREEDKEKEFKDDNRSKRITFLE